MAMIATACLAASSAAITRQRSDITFDRRGVMRMRSMRNACRGEMVLYIARLYAAAAASFFFRAFLPPFLSPHLPAPRQMICFVYFRRLPSSFAYSSAAAALLAPSLSSSFPVTHIFLHLHCYTRQDMS